MDAGKHSLTEATSMHAGWVGCWVGGCMGGCVAVRMCGRVDV
jgi:hypothetical protein